MISPGVMGAAEILAGACAQLSAKYDELGADGIREIENGVEAELHLPTGDRYRIVVEWLGDREAST